MKVLHSIIYAAGYLAIVVLASVIGSNGRPAVGLGIILTLAAVSAALLIASAVVNRRQKRAVESAKNAEAAAAAGQTKSYSANVSESYEHDARTVWSLIRPAESAVLLTDAQRAFTVPGTPAGVGEQQCFIRRDGSVSIIEVIGEEGPWWATTRPVSPGEMKSRSTYRIEPTPTGCTLTLGTVIELPANEVLAEDPDQWWETQMRPYLNRIKDVLAARQT